MKEKKEIIQKEYDTYKNFYDGIKEQLQSLVLMDVIASLMTEEEIKDENSNTTRKVKNFQKFDDLVEKSKNFLQSVVGTPEFNLEQSIRETLDKVDNVKKETLYSMRILSWVNEEVLKEEGNNNA